MLEPLSLSPSSKLASSLRSQSKLGESHQILPDIAESSPFVLGLSGSVFNAQQQYQGKEQASFSTNDASKPGSMTMMATNAASRASTPLLPKTAVSNALGIEASSSLSSVGSAGSLGMSGRASPRISRDEVKRRLMKTRTSPNDIDEDDDGDLKEDDGSQHVQQGQSIQNRHLPLLPLDENGHGGAIGDFSRKSTSPSPEQRPQLANSGHSFLGQRPLRPRLTYISQASILEKFAQRLIDSC
ncbi:hypothetical protein BS47DRAFT_469847 [Hydnum rufescens UP504]|uniref:Uncharacterized protein n=1 Tax=Hydnum rufescens UP504 TaxID=1448309 RepID=A0A9P6B4N5_9AGAM|nr:hypothetical protein BS47DRAFT_469847 [Hydnum rufescens UP504]